MAMDAVLIDKPYSLGPSNHRAGLLFAGLNTLFSALQNR
jgi:hypothetical protein